MNQIRSLRIGATRSGEDLRPQDIGRSLSTGRRLWPLINDEWQCQSHECEASNLLTIRRTVREFRITTSHCALRFKLPASRRVCSQSRRGVSSEFESSWCRSLEESATVEDHRRGDDQSEFVDEPSCEQRLTQLDAPWTPMSPPDDA